MTMTTTGPRTISSLPMIEAMVKTGGPREIEYPILEAAIRVLASQQDHCRIDPDTYQQLIDSCSFLHDKSSIMGHIRTRPYGYAGDFEIIEKIYTEAILTDQYKLWDAYALQHPAAVAVRNRKRYFIDLIRRSMAATGSLRLCDVASGPGRDLLEAYEQLAPGQELRTTCVEMDANAIAYASGLTEKYQASIEFVRKNVFRFHTEERVDLVWSAGLFDYFEDDAFVLLLKRFGGWLKPGGEIVIGNFNSLHNPSRAFMELFGDWHLQHRSEAQLRELALAAGFAPDQISIGREPENINLFLHIRTAS